MNLLYTLPNDLQQLLLYYVDLFDFHTLSTLEPFSKLIKSNDFWKQLYLSIFHLNLFKTWLLLYINHYI